MIDPLLVIELLRQTVIFETGQLALEATDVFHLDAIQSTELASPYDPTPNEL